jgi:hypothetical protein
MEIIFIDFLSSPPLSSSPYSTTITMIIIHLQIPYYSQPPESHSDNYNHNYNLSNHPQILYPNQILHYPPLDFDSPPYPSTD